MADRNHGHRSPNTQEHHPGSRNGRLQQHRLPNQGLSRQEYDHVDSATYLPNGIEDVEPPYNEHSRHVRPDSHEHGNSAGNRSIRRSVHQAPHGHSGGSSARASNQGLHHAGREFSDERPHQLVDRTTYRATARVPNGDSEYHQRGEVCDSPLQDHDPMQRFRTETMRDQAWNGMYSYGSASSPGAARGREPERSHSAGSSLKAENASSSSWGRPY
ncbi:hypothetical protein MMC29_007352 [Sticta canariensis]|nr:hypothetical protein [Sticta canariensis]